MKTNSIIISALLLVSCSKETKKKELFNVCNCQQMNTVKADIKQSIAPANNKSDEEMEDVIRELKRTYIETTCPQKWIDALDLGDRGTYPLNPVDSLFYFN